MHAVGRPDVLAQEADRRLRDGERVGGVGDELGPPLAPQIVGHLGAVGVADQVADLLGPFGDATVHLAGAKHGVRRAVLAQLDFDPDPDWEWRTAADDSPEELMAASHASCFAMALSGALGRGRS